MVCKGDLVNNWEFFRQQWEDYEVATGLDGKSAKIRLATLRSVMGKECLQIFLNLSLTEAEKADVSSCIAALEAYFKPQRNVVYERFVFNSCVQTAAETVDGYVNRLRKLASSCAFGALTDELIRDRLVIGLNDTATKGKLLREQALDLNKALRIARSSEVADMQLKSMKSEEQKKAEEVNMFQKYKKASSRKPKATANKSAEKKHKSSQAKCKYCGREQTHSKVTDCPAYGKTCNSCQKLNHFSSVCRTKGKKGQVHTVTQDYSGSDTDESLLKVEEVSSMGSTGKQWFATLSFADNKQKPQAQLKCQLDTGATCNVMSYNDLSVVTQNGNPPLKMSRVKLRLFDGSMMKPLGEATLRVAHGDQAELLTFQVVQSNRKPLLSAETCQRLKLLTVNKKAVIHSLEATTYVPLTKETILRDFKDVFEGLGHIGDASFVVDQAVTPVQHTTRRIPVALQKEVKAKIDDLEQKGIIQKETSPTEWISSMVVVAKPGKIRICLDPKDLNRAVQRPRYQMPTLEETLPKLSQAKVFSTLDAKDGFYQIRLDEESSKLTTFWTPFGRYRYLRMPFGINLAPEVFECRLQEILADLKGVVVLRDDILVLGYGDTMEKATEDHDKNLISLLKKARQVNLKLNSKKMKLKKPEVQYMGHVISKDGLKPDPEKVKAVEGMPKPTSKQEVLSLLGFVNYLARFLPKLADVAQPLRHLTARDAEFVWAKQHDKAFNEVKKLVVNHPVLKYYDSQEEVTLQCDASEKGLGATLLQNGQPVAFASRTLSPTERKYAQIEKECLAIVFGCERFSQYLSRKEKVTVESDHKPLQSIFKKSVLAAPCRLQRMLLRLQRYNLDVTYKPGSQMYLADQLSRAFLPDQGDSEEDFQVFAVEVEQMNPHSLLKVSGERLAQIQKATEQDPALQTLKTTVLTGWPDRRDDVPVQVRDYWNYREEITLHNGILFKCQRIIVPKALRAEITSRVHSSHLGIEACLRKARDVVFWPSMNSEIKEAITRCAVCAEYQARNSKEPLQTHQIPDQPWSRVAVDLFTLNKKEYIVLTDYYSDYVEVGELSDTTAQAVVQFLKEQFSRHGIPDTLVSDNGPQFTSHEFHEFAQAWEFQHVSSSPHHHKSNGKAESGVKVAKNLFKKAFRDGKDPWLALLDYRNTPVEGIGSSPAQRLMSRRTKTLVPTASTLLQPRVVEGVKEKIEVKRQKAKGCHDRKAKTLPPLEVGQEVRVAPLHRHQSWTSGTCVEKLTDRSYLVKTDKATVIRRNRQMLRPREQSDSSPAEDLPVQIHEDPSTQGQPTVPTHSESIVPGTPPEATTPDTIDVPVQQAEQRTRTRVVRKPTRFQDYVC